LGEKRVDSFPIVDQLVAVMSALAAIVGKSVRVWVPLDGVRLRKFIAKVVMVIPYAPNHRFVSVIQVPLAYDVVIAIRHYCV
jgi:hypothetical protein